MKIFNYEIDKKYLYVGIGIITLIIILIIAFTIARYNPDMNSKEIKNYVETQLKIEKEKYEKIITDNNLKIDLLNKDLIRSQQITNSYKNEITEIKLKIKNIKEPITDLEIIDRLKKLGYNPRIVKVEGQ